jgi:hypothetical protein
MQCCLFYLAEKAGRHSGRFAPSAIGPMAATALRAKAGHFDAGYIISKLPCNYIGLKACPPSRSSLRRNMALPPPPVSVPKKRGLGCLGCGCALLLFIAALIAAVIFGGYHMANSLTDASPASIPQADGGTAVYTTAQHKITDFQQAITQDKPATLHLNSDEINTFIAHDPSMTAARGHLFVKLQDSEATIQCSLPLSMFEKSFMADRYMNCDATLGLAFNPQDKSITVDLHSLGLKGQEIPTSANANLNQTINATIAEQIQASQPAHDFLARTQKITIEKGELVIETK